MRVLPLWAYSRWKMSTLRLTEDSMKLEELLDLLKKLTPEQKRQIILEVKKMLRQGS